MKNLIALMMVLILAVSCAGIAACGGGGDDDTPENSTGGDYEGTPGGNGTATGNVCSGIPVYPGADTVKDAQWSWGGNQAGGYARVEWHYFSVNDDKDDVIAFYEQHMPNAGWENQMNLNMDEWSMTVWTKEGGNTGAGISAGTDDGKTQVAIWCGEGLEDEDWDDNEADNGSNGTPAGGELTWDDVPVYPGAHEAASFSGMMAMAEEGDCDKIEWKYYEADADSSDVVDFYLSEMPKKGWNKHADFGMTMESMVTWILWEKGSGADVAYIWIMGNPDEETVMMMWRGVNCDI